MSCFKVLEPKWLDVVELLELEKAALEGYTISISPMIEKAALKHLKLFQEREKNPQITTPKR